MSRNPISAYRADVLRGHRRIPPSISALWFYSLLRRQERAIKRAWRDERTLPSMIDSINDGKSIALRGYQLFDFRLVVRDVWASQTLDEFVALLDRIGRLRPLRVLEIGTYLGGTLWFLARACDPRAVIVSVDIDAPLFARVQRARLAGRRQRIVSMEGDSHDPATLGRVRAELGHQPVDVLFIDADHSYEAVKNDYEIYSPLVRSGGLIALHDINPRRSGASFGEVPRFWAELHADHPGMTEEFISQVDEGYGIGVIHVPSESS